MTFSAAFLFCAKCFENFSEKQSCEFGQIVKDDVWKLTVSLDKELLRVCLSLFCHTFEQQSIGGFSHSGRSSFWTLTSCCCRNFKLQLAIKTVLTFCNTLYFTFPGEAVTLKQVNMSYLLFSAFFATF